MDYKVRIERANVFPETVYLGCDYLVRQLKKRGRPDQIGATDDQGGRGRGKLASPPLVRCNGNLTHQILRNARRHLRGESVSAMTIATSSDNTVASTYSFVMQGTLSHPHTRELSRRGSAEGTFVPSDTYSAPKSSPCK